MQVKEVGNKDKDLWNSFILQNSGSFLQSFEWGEFQKSLGKKVYRLAVCGDPVSAQALIIEESFPLKFKICFYLPFGPVFRQGLSEAEKGQALSLIIKEAARLAKKEKSVFLKIEPEKRLPWPVEGGKFSLAGFKRAPSLKDIQPKRTLILGLRPSEEELLNSFKQKTRYNIKLAQKKGIKVRSIDTYQPIFYSLLKKTGQRAGFAVFSEKHYQKLFDAQTDDFKVRMFLGELKNKVIAAYILVLFGKIAVCLHGSSDKRYRALKPAEALMRQRIKYAKAHGCKTIDFWGIDKEKWPGITSFKKGFGGEVVVYPDRRDIIFQKNWYRVYKLIRRLK